MCIIPSYLVLHDFSGERELNKVTCEDSPSNDSDYILNGNDANCGSKLLTRDQNNGNYCIMQGIPKSLKFCSISDLYKVIHVFHMSIIFSYVNIKYRWRTTCSVFSFDPQIYDKKKRLNC